MAYPLLASTTFSFSPIFPLAQNQGEGAGVYAHHAANVSNWFLWESLCDDAARRFVAWYNRGKA
jgi:hypothetical protein